MVASLHLMTPWHGGLCPYMGHMRYRTMRCVLSYEEALEWRERGAGGGQRSEHDFFIKPHKLPKNQATAQTRDLQNQLSEISGGLRHLWPSGAPGSALRHPRESMLGHLNVRCLFYRQVSKC
jgi:hypothetical protein